MTKPLKAILTGAGPIGQQVLQVIDKRRDLRLCGVADTDPGKAGKTLGEICSADRYKAVSISPDVKSLISSVHPDIAIITTTSSLQKLQPLLNIFISSGVNVISTCEELIFPMKKYPELSEKIDREAKKHGVSVLGTGINPGFLMDYLPVILTAPFHKVDSIQIDRIQDAGKRRSSFQEKTGVNLSPGEFDRRVKENRIGHTGLEESIDMISHAMGWNDIDIEKTIAPVLAKQTIDTDNEQIMPGKATGLRQEARGMRQQKEMITLNFRATIDEQFPHDRIIIKGDPGIELTTNGNYHGDIATGSLVANALPVLAQATPGLKTMLDLPPVTFIS